jgi:hypothetical protein
MVMPAAGMSCESGQVQLIALPGQSRIVSDTCATTAEQSAVLRYESIVEAGARLAGNMTVGEASADGSTKVEVVMSDVAKAYVPDECITSALDGFTATAIDKLVTDAKACDLVLAQGVTLTTVLRKTYHKVAGSTRIQGLAFSLGGDVFASNEGYALDYRLRIYPYFPMRSYAAVLALLDAKKEIEPGTTPPSKDGAVLIIPSEVASAVISTASVQAQQAAVLQAFVANAAVVNASYASALVLSRTR